MSKTPLCFHEFFSSNENCQKTVILSRFFPLKWKLSKTPMCFYEFFSSNESCQKTVIFSRFFPSNESCQKPRCCAFTIFFPQMKVVKKRCVFTDFSPQIKVVKKPVVFSRIFSSISLNNSWLVITTSAPKLKSIIGCFGKNAAYFGF